jgi:hypothetical protein
VRRQVLGLVTNTLVRMGVRKRLPAFLHVPKTGGTYLVQRESDDDPTIAQLKYLGHHWVVRSLERSDPVYPPQGFRRTFVMEKRSLVPYFVFTTVRNPFSFLVSYLWHAGGLNPKYYDPDHYDYAIATKGFDYLLKTIVNRDEPWPSRKLIHGQLFCDDGDLIVDWINHNESLDADLETMAKQMRFHYQRKKPQRVGRADDYRSYYTDELVDLVNSTWGRELNLFGYKFDGRRTEPALLEGKVTAAQKRGIHYFWEHDMLLLYGEKISHAQVAHPGK